MIQIFKKSVVLDGKEKKGLFYCASFTRRGVADSLALAEEMKENSSSFTSGEVVGVTLDLPKRIKQALLNGMAVKINGLGTFKPSLHTAEVKADPAELKASAVSIKSINFAPDALLLSDLNNKAKFEWIDEAKADTEDKKDGTDEEKPSDENPDDPAPGTGTTTTPPTGSVDGGISYEP